MAKTIWRGNWYKRGGTPRSEEKKVTYRNNYSGQVREGSPKGKILGYERNRISPYGNNPRSKPQAVKDSKSFHHNLNTPSVSDTTRTPRVVSPRR